MGFVFLLLFAVFVVFVLVIVLKVTSRGVVTDGLWPFFARKPLSEPEQILYFRLVKALPEHIILAKVQLSSLLGVQKNHDARAWLKRISLMSADFVVCNKDSSIVAVIELSDETDQEKDSRSEAEKKDRALTSAQVRILRWSAASVPDIAAIQSAFKSQAAAE